MSRPLGAWLGETHGLRFEMVRHFAGRIFDSEMFAVQGQWTRVAVGVVSGLVPMALLMTPTFLRRYACVDASESSAGCPALPDYQAFYSGLARSDMAWLIGLAMCVTAVAVAVVWQALFPSRQDRLALASLPVSARDMFAAKLTASLAVFTVFALAMNGLPATLFGAVIRGGWQRNPSLLTNIAAALASTLSASAFVFFALTALQGCLLNLLPVRVFKRIAPFVQAAILTVALAILPFLWPEPGAAVSPPVSWFVGLWAAVIGEPGASEHAALVAVGLAAALTAASYGVSCGRYERWLIESPAASPRRSRVKAFGSLVLDRWIRDPREQAMFGFITKTLTRSGSHRLALLLFAGLGVVWMAKGVGENGYSPRAGVSGYAFITAFLPLTAAVFGLLALRYLFALPSELRANWIFRLTEAEGRGAWLLAMERFAVCCIVAPIDACGWVAAASALGPIRAARLCLLGFAVALVVFEALFRDWRKAPFTCSYQPGKRPVWLIVAGVLVSLAWIAPATLLTVALSRDAVAFVASFPLVLALWWKLRWRRQTRSDAPLIYEDLPEAVTCPLNIEYDRDSEPQARESETVYPRPAGWTPFLPSPDTPDRQIAAFFTLSGVRGDFRYAFRAIRNHLPLSCAVVATLALGIGMNVAVFTLIHGALLRARVPHPETFVGISIAQESQIGVTDAEYRTLREGTRTMAALAAWRVAAVTVADDHSRTRNVLLASCNFFSVHGLHRPVLGRLLRPADCESGGQAVVVLSEEAWRRQFQADPKLVGRSILVNDRAFTVAGVAPPGYAARVQGADAWLPYSAAALIEPGSDYSKGWLTLEGRLAPGAARGAAQAELRSLATRLERWNSSRKLTVNVSDGSWVSISGANRTYARGLVAAVLGALAVVLLIVCINVTTLLLSRAVARRREIAVRLALGAPKAQLARMLFIETFLLTAAAGAAGLYIAHIIPKALYSFLMNETPDFSLAPDWTTVFYIVGLVLLTTCLAGLSPVLESLRVDLASALKGYQTAAGGPVGGFRIRQLLVSLQLAMSLMLLVAAGLCARILLQMRLTDPGLDTRQVLAVKLRFPQSDKNASGALLRLFQERIRQLPGVQRVAYADGAPFDGELVSAIASADSQVALSLHSVEPGYFETLGIPILRGRSFRESDPMAGRAAQAVLSENVARALWPGQDPIGRHVELSAGPALEVIGVSRDVKDPMSAVPPASAYVAGDMSPLGSFLFVRCATDPKAVAREIQGAIRQVAPGFSVTPTPLQALLDEPVSFLLRFASAIWLMGLIACALAIAGICGVVSFEVSRRTKEIGIRAALGAQRRDILREILLSAGRPILVGVLSGLWLSLAGSALMRRVLSEAPPGSELLNTVIYLGAALLLAFAAGVAVLISAHRGARLDPTVALRYQ